MHYLLSYCKFMTKENKFHGFHLCRQCEINKCVLEIIETKSLSLPFYDNDLKLNKLKLTFLEGI